MDIEDLNKSQLILLAVLLSFITSIATGITTVTLMQQAPQSVAVPINRVIQQTVEKIQQVEGKTTVQTVVVKEEDLVVDAISKNQSATFTVTRGEVSAGRGFAVSKGNVIVVDGNLIPDRGAYYVTNAGGKFRAEFISADNRGFAFLRVTEPVDGDDKLTYTVPEFGDLNKMKIGQKILILGNTLSSSIYEGNSSINGAALASNAGGLILNLDGEALGIALSNTDVPFASIEVINEALKTVSPS